VNFRNFFWQQDGYKSVVVAGVQGRTAAYEIIPENFQISSAYTLTNLRMFGKNWSAITARVVLNCFPEITNGPNLKFETGVDCVSVCTVNWGFV
jgi:hypothetical protein